MNSRWSGTLPSITELTGATVGSLRAQALGVSCRSLCLVWCCLLDTPNLVPSLCLPPSTQNTHPGLPPRRRCESRIPVRQLEHSRLLSEVSLFRQYIKQAPLSSGIRWPHSAGTPWCSVRLALELLLGSPNPQPVAWSHCHPE